MALSKKRKAFINEYLKCWNASEAARKAGYSVRSAGSIGHEILQIPEVQQEISRRIEEMTMSADEVLIGLGGIARNATSKDRIRALELIGKHHKLFTENVDLTSGGKTIDVKFVNDWRGNTEE
jgi:phage terminase small subunit